MSSSQLGVNIELGIKPVNLFKRSFELHTLLIFPDLDYSFSQPQALDPSSLCPT